MEAGYSIVLERVEQVLERHRQAEEPPTPQEIDDLYTDACATVLLLEARRSGLERRLTEAIAADSDEAEAIRNSRDLARQRERIDEELSALRSLVRGLGTAANWSRDPEWVDARYV